MNSEDLEKVNYAELRDWLTSGSGRLIVSGNQAIRVCEAKGYSREDNATGYSSLLDKKPGRILAFHRSWRKTNLTLITACDHRKPGGCVQIEVAEKREGAQWKTLKFQRDIAEVLGLKTDDQYGPNKDYPLQVVEGNYLWVVKRRGPELTAKEASRRLKGLLE
jgi:hypothetical protein